MKTRTAIACRYANENTSLRALIKRFDTTLGSIHRVLLLPTPDACSRASGGWLQGYDPRVTIDRATELRLARELPTERTRRPRPSIAKMLDG